MRPKITIALPAEPFLPLEEYCRRTGMRLPTARNLIKYGKLPIKPKGDEPKSLVEVNMVALFLMALEGHEVSIDESSLKA